LALVWSILVRVRGAEDYFFKKTGSDRGWTLMNANKDGMETPRIDSLLILFAMIRVHPRFS
jgi:hypothetical protein